MLRDTTRRPNETTKKPMNRIQHLSLTLFVVVAATIAGCGDDVPEAPELRDSPVYRNASEGFRFLVPKGWTQTASSILPPGQLDGTTFLVRYRVKSPEAGSTLQIECTQDKPSVDLAEMHGGASYRVKKWSPKAPPEEQEFGGRKGTRLVFEAEVDGRTVTKEVVCFRNNDRIYSFVGLFSSTDEKAQQQIHRALGSLIWE